MTEKEKIIKEHSREYSLFRLSSMYLAYYKHFPEVIGKTIDGGYMVYRGKSLVHVCYKANVFRDIFMKVGSKANKDPRWLSQQIKDMEELFAWLKPYYDGKKFPQNIVELKEFYNKYSKYFFLVGIVYTLPQIQSASEGDKKIALKIREKTQEYNECPEVVYKSALERLYPHLKGKTQFLLPEEVWSGEADKESILKKIHEREKGFVYYSGKLYVGEDVNSHLDKLGVILEEYGEKEASELKGQVAYKGIVRGRVKLVSNMGDSEQVKEGDVLVTTMTMPKYIMAMKRAGAFITDEGGITCHASIVARELKKPCVIGTKFATEVLKDGDMVEVNADKGVVRILEKAK